VAVALEGARLGAVSAPAAPVDAAIVARAAGVAVEMARCSEIPPDAESERAADLVENE